MKALAKTLPFLVILAVVILLWRQLFYSNIHDLPSPIVNQSVPTFSLNTIHDPFTKLSNDDVAQGLKILVFWATWCGACREDHPMLVHIAQDYHIPMYGIIYKDDQLAAKEWLNTHGNPYRKVGDDAKGEAAIDFGIYGTPEMYIIANGKIVYRQIGVVDEETWQETLLPIIKKYINN